MDVHGNNEWPVAGLSRRGFLVATAGLAAAACTSKPRAATVADDAGLRSAIRGRMLLPGNEGFDPARTPWNTTIDQSVRAVAEIADADDAAALVRYARDTGLAVAVQPNGHGASGAADGTILVRTNRLNDIRLDTSTRTARVGAGVSWEPVQQKASEHGLTGVAGSAAAVGITGYTLGGGLSWFGRRFGWAADSVTAFDVIDADGRALRVSATSEPDLFWALRGGGGDYALVTAIEFELHSAPMVFGGRMLWPLACARQVMSAFRDVTAIAPDELTVWWSLYRFPGAPPMVGIDTTYLGDAETGRELLRAFDLIDGRISDSRRGLSISELGSITGEPTDPSPVRQHGALLTGLDDTIVDSLLAQPMDPLFIVHIRHLGGALARPSDTAAGPVTEPYFLNLLGVPTTEQAATGIDAAIRGYLDAVDRNISGRTPFTFLTPGRNATEAFPPDTVSRLAEIKRRYDPHRVFRSNFPVLT
ncbi:FAD-binding oxidoreductase [Nocardia huaxiensis]|uniref:FAD-binding oxidoreductase n=1 Tax=Nocardia huaxiensis TaxID=2755382 RepID=A0A7D6V881_9NOCA|nr:FAD-dependent oxidoreductase [Nocardia huaxiensis]QLY28711.1 FAD-binding oxidoreductase [Nocardia huaxiensis]UFS97813.1 FAD-dependent oxidoreductase [Nocardia huaxiensis]